MKPKKPKESSRILRAMKGKVKTVIGAGWEGTLTEWVKGIIQPCIKKHRSFSSDDYAELLEKRAKWVVKTYAQPLTDENGMKKGGKIEL